jgi:hypothetical protein
MITKTRSTHLTLDKITYPHPPCRLGAARSRADGVDSRTGITQI